jgi:hypothetical protein
MPRLFQHVSATNETARDLSSGWLPPVPADDDLALGLECANPTLQIERWMCEAELIESPPMN